MTDAATLKERRKAHATFLFGLYETVDADPALQSAPCLSVILVYGKYAKYLGGKSTAYASKVTLMAETGKGATTVKRARSLLVEYGYLVPVGATESGCTIYRLENPRADLVQMHVTERKWKLEQGEVDRKEAERRKAKSENQDNGRGSDMNPPEMNRGVRNGPDRGSDMDPNSLDYSLEALAFEEREGGLDLSCGNDFPTREVDFGPWVYQNIPDHSKRREALRLLRAGQMTPEIFRRMAA